MLDTEKYMNTMNLGSEDDNKFDLKLGDICHTAGTYVKANSYNYCGYEEFEIPTGSRARIIGIKQTGHNACYAADGRGDVYIDFELVDHTNPDGTPIRCGNRHAGCFAETSLDFAFCPDGSGEPGYLRRKDMRHAGLWVSLESTQIEDHPEHGYCQWQHRKVVDPKQYVQIF